MTSPADTAPSTSELAPDTLLSLVAALASAATIAQLVELLSELPGVSRDAIDALFELNPVFRKGVRVLPKAAAASPDPVRHTARLNLVRRAQYLANAARRVSSSGDLREAVARETKHFRAHKAATARRNVVADRVVSAQDRFGDLLGWHATLDSRTSPDCRAANGTNFQADRMPAIGYPGAVHPECRCRPGKPYPQRRRKGGPSGTASDDPGTREAVVAAVNKYKGARLVELARETGSLRSMAVQLGISRPSLTNYLLRRPELNEAVRSVLVSQARLDLAADHKSSSHPDPPNKPGQNWIEKIGGHLPPFIKRVAKHIMADSGYPQSRAIASAISQCKKGRLGPKGLAAAAQWEALKAKAHALSHEAGAACVAIELAIYSSQQLGSYYSQPPKKTLAAQAKGGGSGGKKKVVRTEAGAKRYKVPIGSEIGSARDANAAQAQQNAGAVDRYKQTVGATDRDKQVAGLNPKDLGDLSRVAFSFKSSDPNVVALRSSVVRELTKRGMDPKQFGYLGGSGKSTAKVVAKAPVRKATLKRPTPASVKKVAPLPPRKSQPGRVRVQ